MSQLSDTCKESTYKQVFFSESEKLRNFIYYKCGNNEQSRDLVQEAFSKLWENCKKVPPEKAKSYLFTVANNLFLNQVARKKVKLRFESERQESTEHQSPQFLLEEKEFKARLEEAISSLPEDQRTIFLMNRIDKLKYREIATSMDISIKTVEKKMHLALKALRKIHKKV